MGDCRFRVGPFDKSTDQPRGPTSKGDETMEYLLMIYESESDWAALSDEARGAMYKEYYEFTDGIRQSGHYKGGNPLQPVATATTVRVREGKTMTTDGPFAET